MALLSESSTKGLPTVVDIPPPSEAKPKSPGKLLTFQELMELEPPEYLIHKVLPAGSLAMVYGPSGVGKTFAVLDFACHIVEGRPWQGRVTMQGAVAYLAAEGLFGFPARLSAWSDGVVPRDSNLHESFYSRGEAVDLCREEDVEELLSQLSQIPDLRLVVIDTLARCMSGKENDATEMGMVIRSCDRIREATGATVLLVHHTGKDKAQGERGSSALRGAMDCMILLEEVDGCVKVSCTKQKEDEEFSPVYLAKKKVELVGERWRPGQSSLRFVTAIGPRKSDTTADKLNTSARRIAEVLANMPGHIGVPSGELREACKPLGKEAYSDALKAALKRGWVFGLKSGRYHLLFDSEAARDEHAQRDPTCSNVSSRSCSSTPNDMTDVTATPKGAGTRSYLGDDGDVGFQTEAEAGL